MTHHDLAWVKLSEETVYKGFRHIVRRQYRLPSGVIKDFDVELRGHCAGTVALTPDNQVIVFAQFRPGPERVMYEIPGGVVEEGEEAMAAAERELLEETGYRGKMQHATTVHKDAYLSGPWDVFVATDCQKVAEPENSKNEPGQMLLLSLDEFKEKMAAGHMTDLAGAYAGLQLLGLL